MEKPVKIFSFSVTAGGLIAVALLVFGASQLLNNGGQIGGQTTTLTPTATTGQIAGQVTVLPVTGDHVGPAQIYPRSDLTPGSLNPDVTQATIGQTICKSGWTDTVRPPESVTNKIKQQVLAQYGYPDVTADYELDHFISLELGGAPADPKNLWPESYGDLLHPMSSTQRAHSTDTAILPGSLQKDRVETGLKTEICKSEITLSRAQQIIVTDWYACYLKLESSQVCE